MTKKILKYFSICAIFASCTYPKSDATKVVTAIVGGKTESQSAQFDPYEKTRFDAIASHVVLITLDEVTPTSRQAIYSATGVIIGDQTIVTAAHTFEDWHFDATHVGSIYFGSSGAYQDRPRIEFSKSNFVGRTPEQVDELAQKDWSTKDGNLDFVLLKIADQFPAGFSKIQIISSFAIYKTGDHFRAAGFGLSEKDAQDFQLRTLDLTLSRKSLAEASDKYAMTSQALEPGERKYFMEFNAKPFSTVQHGDSGGPYYYEEVGDDGALHVYLAGIVISHLMYGCDKAPATCNYGDYALRADAFK